MGDYMLPIKVALIIFPVLAFILVIPFLVYQNRVYGYVKKLKGAVLYSFILYLILVFYLAMLPLPDQLDKDSPNRVELEEYNLRPFKFIEDICDESKLEVRDPSTYKYLLTEAAFLEFLFHLLIFIPLGVYLRSHFEKNLLETVAIALLLTLTLKMIQTLGFDSVYNRKYRLFDIDDFILNALSGFIGYYLAPVIMYLFPKVTVMDSQVLALGMDFEEVNVGYIRRLLAFLVDIWLISLLPIDNQDLLGYFSVSFIYFILLVYLTNGQTVGKWLTNTRVLGQGEKLKFKEAFLRYGILIYGYFGTNRILSLVVELNESTRLLDYLVIIKTMQIIFNILVWLHVILSILIGKELFHEKLSGTRTEINES